MSAARGGLSIKAADFQVRDFGVEYKGIAEDPSTGDLSFWPDSSRTPTELQAVRLLWHICPVLRSKLNAWVWDGAYRDLSCNVCGKRARVWRLDCRCRLLSVEYAQRWLAEKFSYGPLYETLVEVCRAESLSSGAFLTDKNSAQHTKRDRRRAPSWRANRRELGPHTCVLVESRWSDWKVTRRTFELLEYKYGLGGPKSEGWGLVQLLHPALPRVCSLYVGPRLPEAEWRRLGVEVLASGQFTPLFDRLRTDWDVALRGMSDEDRGVREAELQRVPLLTRRGIFYQPGMFPKARAAARSQSQAKPRKSVHPLVPRPGDPCPCGKGYLHTGEPHRELGNWSGTVEELVDQFED